MILRIDCQLTLNIHFLIIIKILAVFITMTDFVSQYPCLSNLLLNDTVDTRMQAHRTYVSFRCYKLKKKLP